MDRILIGIIGIPLGIIIIIYRFQVKQFTGNIAFAEQYFGAGGTYTFLIVAGLVISVFSLLYAGGTIQEFLGGTLGSIF